MSAFEWIITIGFSAKKVEWPARRAGGPDGRNSFRRLAATVVPISNVCAGPTTRVVRRSAADVEWSVGRKFWTTAVVAVAAAAGKGKGSKFRRLNFNRKFRPPATCTQRVSEMIGGGTMGVYKWVGVGREGRTSGRPGGRGGDKTARNSRVPAVTARGGGYTHAPCIDCRQQQRARRNRALSRYRPLNNRHESIKRENPRAAAIIQPQCLAPCRRHPSVAAACPARNALVPVGRASYTVRRYYRTSLFRRPR